MAVTQASLRQRIKRIVYTQRPALRPYEDRLTAQSLAADTTLDVSDGTSWASGDVVEFSDGEQALVVSVAANVLTVLRGSFGTTAATQASGTDITKNPRFSLQAIDDAIETVLYDLYPRVYVLESVAFGTVVQSQEWYPISTAGVFDVLSVYYEDSAYDIPTPINSWAFRKTLEATEFTNAQGLFIPGFGAAANGESLYVTWKRKISAVTDLLDRQEPLVALGATYYLLGGQTVARTHDPGQRTDRTVQPGQDGRDSIWFLREYRAMLTQEEIRLERDAGDGPYDRRQRRKRRWRP